MHLSGTVLHNRRKPYSANRYRENRDGPIRQIATLTPNKYAKFIAPRTIDLENRKLIYNPVRSPFKNELSLDL